MSKYDYITADLLNNLFEYDNGKLYWKVATGSTSKGKEAGYISNNGYKVVQINNEKYLVHRLIFCMHHGYFPKCTDHKNANKLDNRIENLREATFAQNVQNQPMRKTNTSGIKNVSWCRKSKKWKVQFSYNNKFYYFGVHDTMEQAAKIAEQKRTELHKEFARHE
jgi:hypothetical protein